MSRSISDSLKSREESEHRVYRTITALTVYVYAASTASCKPSLGIRPSLRTPASHRSLPPTNGSVGALVRTHALTDGLPQSFIHPSRRCIYLLLNLWSDQWVSCLFHRFAVIHLPRANLPKNPGRTGPSIMQWQSIMPVPHTFSLKINHTWPSEAQFTDTTRLLSKARCRPASLPPYTSLRVQFLAFCSTISR